MRNAGGVPNEQASPAVRDTETGNRSTPENSMKYMYRQMWVDPEVRRAILDIREMDREDGRVKYIHKRVARDTVKGGLVFTQTKPVRSLVKEWEDFARRLQLHRPEKLKSDARGLAMEGNLPLQWVVDDQMNMVAAVRMPSETILPNVDEGGRFKDVKDAYWQIDLFTGTKLVGFPLWNLFLCRFDPDSFDDVGAMGRPFLDASREVWRKLRMTEEDLVIRRRHRAPLRLSHVLEGANQPDMQKYIADTESKKGEITTDFYSNKKGSVTAVQGDATLGDIGDVVHLLDTFFAGTPLPKGMMGYTDGMARDILEDLKRSYYDEVDAMQDAMASSYAVAFRIHLLFKGIDPGVDEFTLRYAQRRTETPNQVADLALKYMSLGLPDDMVYADMGLDPDYVRAKRIEQAERKDPYPPAAQGAGRGQGGMPRVSVTPGNAPKGESATAVSQVGGNGGKGRS